MPFSNRVAVVTGASGYIGGEIVRQFLLQGVAVAMTDIVPDGMNRLREELAAEGLTRVRAYQHDVTNNEQTQQVFAQILQDFGHIDILVNNAGVWEHRDAPGQQRLEDMTLDEWRRIIDISLHGTIHCMQAALPHMVQANYGRIINLGSIAGNCGLPGFADYSAAKAGVIMLTKVAAMENGTRNITVNVVSPGMIHRIPAPNSGTWVGHNGSAYDVARCVLFLADDEAGYITGIDLPIDGGRTLGPHNANMKG
ncbi:MAG: SDR family NAD(P)-dependent oxidoreductase [Oligosphaeraceae bacterium]